MSEFESNELILSISSNINDQFQFWMAATFAVIIVSYTAGQRLAVWARLIIAMLYAGTVAMLYLRLFAAVAQAARPFELLSELNPEFVDASGLVLIPLLRRIVMLGGSLLAIVLICMPSIGMQKKSNAHDTSS